MTKQVSLLLKLFLIPVFLWGCSSVPAPQPAKTQSPTLPLQVSTPLQDPTSTPEPSQTETVISAVPEVNPLTGQAVQDPAQLKRRPILVKIQNAPREDRPPFGLSAADIVFEYSIEFGDTRFAAIYYSHFPEKIGPIRSARHIDIHLVRGYKSVLVFGGAYDDLMNLLSDSDFGDRLVREGPNTEPAMFRYDPEGKNYLLTDLTLMDPILEKYSIDNQPQNLKGMLFSDELPQQGEPASQLAIRFSPASYNTWQYDPSAGSYLRFSETQNDLEDNNPQVAPHVDRNTEEQIAAENVVVLQSVYFPLIKTSSSEVYDIQLIGSGNAYLARDGKIFPLTWQRKSEDDVVSLVDGQGNPFPFKPGQTWFEVLSTNSQINHQDQTWTFKNWLP
jgi:hypothetical protein